jgi:hypothetical protein
LWRQKWQNTGKPDPIALWVHLKEKKDYQQDRSEILMVPTREATNSSKRYARNRKNNFFVHQFLGKRPLHHPLDFLTQYDLMLTNPLRPFRQCRRTAAGVLVFCGRERTTIFQ